MKKLRLSFLALLLLSSLFSFSQDLLQWRGIDRTGHFASKDLLDEWPETGPKEILSIDNLPLSYSSVLLKDNVLFTTGINDTAESLIAIDMSGNIKWNTVYGKAWENSYPNARCTPTIEDNYAYLISGSGTLAKIDITNGKTIWSFNGYEKFEGSWGKWGVAESPLIVDDKMIYTPGGDKTTIVAVSKNTGETIWMSKSLQDKSSYCSPVLVEKGDLKLIVTVTAKYVIAVNADNGEIFWKFDYSSIDKPFAGYDINPVTPLVVDNDIFVTSGYNHVGIMLHMADDYKSVELKWKTENLDIHHGGAIVYDGYIFGANYTSIVKGNWVCLDWNTGELKYEHTWYGKGSIIFTDGKLICYDERRGNIALVNATPEKFDLISEFKIEKGKGPHWSHPTIYDEKLFIRRGTVLMVYDIASNVQ